MLQNLKFPSELLKRWIMFRCVTTKRVAFLCSERLKWSVIILTSCRVCLLSGIRRNEKKENRSFRDPDEFGFLTLSAPHSFYACPVLKVRFLLAAGSLQKRRISRHFSVSLCVIGNRRCLLSFSKPKCRRAALSFLPHLMVTYLLLYTCGPAVWQVCLNVPDGSQWKTGRCHAFLPPLTPPVPPLNSRWRC